MSRSLSRVANVTEAKLEALHDGWLEKDRTQSRALAHFPTAFARHRQKSFAKIPPHTLGTVWLADNAMEIPQISGRAQVQDLVLRLWEPFASSGVPHT